MLFRIYQPEITSEIALTQEAAHYLTNVLKLKLNDHFEVLDGRGQIGVYQIEESSKKHLRATLGHKYSENNEPAIKLTIAQALPKADKLEYILQKCTEIGVAEFILYEADKSPVKANNSANKLARWQKIIEAAVCQSRRSSLPAISIQKNISEVLNYKGKIYFADLLPGAIPLGQIQDRACLLIIGPESGFSEAEQKHLLRKATAVSLGRTVLRTETSALAAAARILL